MLSLMLKRPSFNKWFLLMLFGAFIVAQSQKLTALEVGFFPVRPKSVVLRSATGIIEDYGIGMKSGGVRIQPTIGRRIYFYVSDKMIINGKRVMCTNPPYGTYMQPPFCSDWPRNLIIGKTHVTVTYWKSTRYGKPVNVTDRIDY